MSIRKLQDILVKIAEGPAGGLKLGVFLFLALLIYVLAGKQDIPFIYQQF